MLDELLRRHWRVTGRILALGGGMNSNTWLVSTGSGRLVAKAVPAEAGEQLAAGLAVAAAVDAAGVPAGAALRTVDARLVVRHAGQAVALLRYVGGRPLTDADQPLIGATLASVHRAAGAASVPPSRRLADWIDVAAPHLGLEPWLRPAVRDALAAYRNLPTLTHGLLHGDPAPEAFRYDGVRCGLIDWPAALAGPLLYDLASAVMYVGGPERAGALLSGYAAGGVLAAEELTWLPVLLRLRFAVQADYFARRTAAGDLTGIDGPDGNAKGLADARRALTGR